MRSDFRLRRCPRFLEPGRKTAEAARGVLRGDIPQHQMELNGDPWQMKLNTKLAMSQQDKTQDTCLRWNALVTHEGGPNMPKRWSWGFPAVAVEVDFWVILTLGIYSEKWCPSVSISSIKFCPWVGPRKIFVGGMIKRIIHRKRWITLDYPCVSHLGFRGHGCVCNYIQLYYIYIYLSLSIYIYIYIYIYLFKFVFIFIYVLKMYTCEYHIVHTPGHSSRWHLPKPATFIPPTCHVPPAPAPRKGSRCQLESQRCGRVIPAFCGG